MDAFLAAHNLVHLRPLLAQHEITLDAVRLKLFTDEDLVKIGVPLGSARLLIYHATTTPAPAPRVRLHATPKDEIWFFMDGFHTMEQRCTPQLRAMAKRLTRSANHLIRWRILQAPRVTRADMDDLLVHANLEERKLWHGIHESLDALDTRAAAEPSKRYTAFIVSDVRSGEADNQDTCMTKAAILLSIGLRRFKCQVFFVPLTACNPDTNPMQQAAEYGSDDVRACVWPVVAGQVGGIDILNLDTSDEKAIIGLHRACADWWGSEILFRTGSTMEAMRTLGIIPPPVVAPPPAPKKKKRGPTVLSSGPCIYLDETGVAMPSYVYVQFMDGTRVTLKDVDLDTCTATTLATRAVDESNYRLIPPPPSPDPSAPPRVIHTAILFKGKRQPRDTTLRAMGMAIGDTAQLLVTGTSAT